MSEPAWIPLLPSESNVAPPVDGKWAKAEGGALVWKDLPPPVYPGVVTPDTDWHSVGAAGEPPYQSGWTAYASTAYAPVRFRRLLDGIVVLEGMAAGGPAGIVFTLPVGYRPVRQYEHHFLTAAYGVTLPWGSVYVTPAGTVNAAVADGGYLSLAGVTFLAI